MKIKSQNLWRWWAKAIGEKASKCDRESDAVAMIRSVIFVTYLITNCFIIRHWNDEVPSNLSQAEKEKIIKANRSFLYD
jgi:hypothetical protein